MMKSTYRAMQASQPGILELVERQTPTPGPGQVLLAVEACGVCGADAIDVDRVDPGLQPPRVPGHEVVGRIAALGDGVPALWRMGQRVGVGRLGGHCNQCVQCRQGRFQLCENQLAVGSGCDGGYAEMMLARHTALVAIPEELSSAEAAPILCAGIATFNALKKCGAQAGDTVAILGIGGLGHMALQYARRMGFRVVAVGRGSDIAADVLALGAHVYIDNRKEDATARLKAMGGAQAIVTTIADMDTVSALLPGLAPEGRLVVLNPGKDPLQVPAGLLIGGQRGILGSLTGTPCDNEKTLAFSVLVDARPRIEVMPLVRANEALRRLKSGDVKYRLVLSMEEVPGAH